MAVTDLRRRLATGVNAVLVALAVLACLALVTELASDHAVRLDWTEHHTDSLAPDTLAVVGRLDAEKVELVVTAFSAQARDAEAAQRDRLMRDLLGRLDRASPWVRTQFVDFDRDRVSAESLGVDRYGTVVLQLRDDRIDLQDRDLFDARGPRGNRDISLVAEAPITAGARRLLSGRSRTVYWLGGHGERVRFDRGLGELESLAGVLQDQGWTVRDLDLLQGGGAPAVPDDAAAVFVVGPRAPLTRGEEQALRDHVAQGGSLAVMVDPGGYTPTLLEELGVTVEAGLVLDPASYFPHGDRPAPQVRRARDHRVGTGGRTGHHPGLGGPASDHPSTWGAHRRAAAHLQRRVGRTRR